MGIDVIYTLAKLYPPALKPYRNDLIEILNELKFDKMKPVREASNEALAMVKEVPESEVE